MHVSRLVLRPLALPCLLIAMGAVALASSGGKTGYSGNPAHNGGQICSKCHTGGATPMVTMSGPTTVEAGRTYRFSLLIEEGQRIAGGLDVSVTDGTLAAIDAGTSISSGELVQTTPRSADASGVSSSIVSPVRARRLRASWRASSKSGSEEEGMRYTAKRRTSSSFLDATGGFQVRVSVCSPVHSATRSVGGGGGR